MTRRALILAAILAILLAFHGGYLIGKRRAPEPAAIPAGGVCQVYWRSA